MLKRLAMDNKDKILQSSALQVNLERTAVQVEIPEKYSILLRVAEKHYGVSKRTLELLLELNHPYINWEYVLKMLKTISIGDFYEFNKNTEGLQALEVILGIYFDVITSSPSEDIRETVIRYLFEFISTIASNSNAYLSRNIPLLPFTIRTLLHISENQAFIFKKSSGNAKTLLKCFEEQKIEIPHDIMQSFLFRVFNETYTFWLTQPDPSEWTPGEKESSAESRETYQKLIKPLSYEHLKILLNKLETLNKNSFTGNDKFISEYLDLPDYTQITNGYFLIADQLEKTKAFEGQQHLVKLNFLFHMLNVPGLSDVYINALWEINRSLSKVFTEENHENLHEFIKRIFRVMQKSSARHEHHGAIIDCVTTIAREIFLQNNHQLVETFIEELICYGFQYPEIKGSNTEWQIQVNPTHIMNIRSWLDIIAMKPRWTKRLLSALIINLKLGGIFIRDTDIIQKDISNLLNSDIAPAYNLVKQLLRIFPVYFSEIGAEGELRDTSTKVDELSHRNDKLIYFLRKQSHVESNSLLVNFIEDIFRYWHSGTKDYIKKHLPDEVFEQVDNKGEFFDGMHKAFVVLFPKIENNPLNLLAWDKTKIQRELQKIKRIPERDKERSALIIRLYQLLYKKYNFEHLDLLRDMEASGMFSITKIHSLKRHLQRKNYFKSLEIILDSLSMLKEKILSSQKTTPFENIYFKRHIAAGIPSMYGTYKELKFESTGFSLRLESLAGVLFEELTKSLNLKFITKSTLIKIHECLWLYVRALELEGISTESLVTKMKYITSALQIRQFSIDQYIDIFKFIAKSIQGIIRDYYIDAHRSNLPIIVRQFIEKKNGAGHLTTDLEELTYQHSENFIRSIISSAFGLQVLDNLNNNIIKNLNAELEKFKDNKQILNLVMAYIPELAISPIYKADKNTDNQILVGNKGYFLKKLASMGFPVPPGFVITTEVFRGYDAVVGYKYIFKDLSLRIYNEIKQLEKMTGCRYGDDKNPLLLSVRSGATMSLPGMMRSFLNVGINEAIAEGLSRKPDFAWAAWDSYRRFLQTWGMFTGLERNFFDIIIDSFKSRYNVTRKIEFDPEQMRQVTLAYKNALRHKGIEIPDDPYGQLQQAILQVFDSWYSDQAATYRHQMHISDEWGTAVIVQKMVFGNLNDNSGSGVIFTRSPRGISPDVTLYGDFIFGVQGDDIVSGLVETYPVSEKQRVMEKRESGISLEKNFPEVYGELKRLSEVLIYEKGFNHQEIEFTFESPTKNGLYILQTRDMVQQEAQKLKRFKDIKELEESLLGTGIGVSGGALCGRAVYSEEEIMSFRENEPGTSLVLIRPDTVPDDIGILLHVEGLLTSRGGSTSHAAVTIPQLNKVGVVGFNKLKVYEIEGYSTVDGSIIKSGDFIGIDGNSGAVYSGKHEYEQE
jgi:pyruvate,orthophosphate dikinase